MNVPVNLFHLPAQTLDLRPDFSKLGLGIDIVILFAPRTLHTARANPYVVLDRKIYLVKMY